MYKAHRWPNCSSERQDELGWIILMLKRTRNGCIAFWNIGFVTKLSTGNRKKKITRRQLPILLAYSHVWVNIDTMTLINACFVVSVLSVPTVVSCRMLLAGKIEVNPPPLRLLSFRMCEAPGGPRLGPTIWCWRPRAEAVSTQVTDTVLQPSFPGQTPFLPL